jgi:AcrR family transcriptional regulator
MSRSVETTRKNLEMALYRLQKGRGKIVKGGRLTVAAVAKEAGVSTATIHNRHPEIAEQIRALQGKESRRQRDRKHAELQRVREAHRALRAELAELAELKADLEKLASINETLALENRVLRAERDDENVAASPRR